MQKKLFEVKSQLKGARVFKSSFFKDSRGTLWTSWKKNFFKINFKHDKFSFSKKNVLRGFHGDSKTWKLISCVYGSFYFVVVNYDIKSKDYLKSQCFILSSKNKLQVLVPPKFLNAHLCISDECIFHYKLSYKGNYNDVKNQTSVKWNDPRLKIKWPIKKPSLSKRDS
jgi:dTDP-4-dehydrorhamnose 3,5-epimerase